MSRGELYGGHTERSRVAPDHGGAGAGANYGAISTTMPDGNLQNHLIWVHTDGERLFVNTEVYRQKYRNVQRDPKVTLTIRDEEDPYRYAEVRGEVVEVVTGPEARGHIDQLSQKYNGQDYDSDDIKTEWVTLWIVPYRQTLIGTGADEGDPSSWLPRCPQDLPGTERARGGYIGAAKEGQPKR